MIDYNNLAFQGKSVSAGAVDGVWYYVLRPRGVPCLSFDMLLDLRTAFYDFQCSDCTIAVVLSDREVFSLGGDLEYFVACIEDRNWDDLHRYAELAAELVSKQHEQARVSARKQRQKVTIAYIDGNALGGGYELALACDLIVVDTSHSDFVIGMPETRFGMYPGMGGPALLAERVGRTAMMNSVMQGIQHSTADCLDSKGLVDYYGTLEEVLQYVKKSPYALGGVVGSTPIIFNRNLAMESAYKWVECAMHLSPGNLRKMKALSRMQRDKYIKST